MQSDKVPSLCSVLEYGHAETIQKINQTKKNYHFEGYLRMGGGGSPRFPYSLSTLTRMNLYIFIFVLNGVVELVHEFDEKSISSV